MFFRNLVFTSQSLPHLYVVLFTLTAYIHLCNTPSMHSFLLRFGALLRFDALRKENLLYRWTSYKKGEEKGWAEARGLYVHLELRTRSLDTSRTTTRPGARLSDPSPKISKSKPPPCRLPLSLLHLATQIQSSSDRNGQNHPSFLSTFAALGQRELGGGRDGKARIRRVSV